MKQKFLDRKKLGNLGEKIAENFLRKKGYEILDKNYSSKIVSGPQRGEIDIIARNRDTISFVEVKTLTFQDTFLPEDRVDFQKQRKIVKTAENWLMEKKIPLDDPWQVDVVSVKIDLNSKKARIRYFPNAVC